MNERARLTRYSIKTSRSANVTASGAESLAERAHLNLDSIGHVAFLSEPATAWPEDAGGVGFVHHEPRAVFFLERHDFAERGNVAIHGEHAFGDDERATAGFVGRAGLLGGPARMSSRSLRSLWAKTRSLAPGKPGGVNDAGVDELVEDEDVVLADRAQMVPTAAA